MGPEKVSLRISPGFCLEFHEKGAKSWNDIRYDEVFMQDEVDSLKEKDEKSQLSKDYFDLEKQTEAVKKCSNEVVAVAIEKSKENLQIPTNSPLPKTNLSKGHSIGIQKQSSSSCTPPRTNLQEKRQIAFLEKQIRDLKDLQNKIKLLDSLEKKGEISRLEAAIAKWSDGCSSAVEAFRERFTDAQQANLALRGLFTSFELDPSTLDIDLGEIDGENEQESMYYD